MRNEPWVWPEVGDAGTSGAGAVPLRSAQMMRKQKKKKNMSNNLGAVPCVSHGAVGADGCHDDTDVISETSPATESV